MYYTCRYIRPVYSPVKIILYMYINYYTVTLRESTSPPGTLSTSDSDFDPNPFLTVKLVQQLTHFVATDKTSHFLIDTLTCTST